MIYTRAFERAGRIFLRKQPISALVTFDILIDLPPDFMEDGRGDELPQVRDSF